MNSNSLKIALAILILLVVFRQYSTRKRQEGFQPAYDIFSPLSQTQPLQVEGMTQRPMVAQKNTATRPPTTSADLLPKVATKEGTWDAFSPRALTNNSSFLDSVKYIGVDTQGNSLRNASWDIRSTPVIEKRGDISPFLNSTIDADLLRRPLE